MNSTISIIIPAYNAEKTIKRCIDSILQQTYTNFEIIIIDDGSTDNTLTVCNNIKDNRIKPQIRNYAPNMIQKRK